MSKSLQIMIVDDDKALAHVITKRLSSVFTHAKISHFTSCTAAKDFLTSGEAPDIDLLLLDHHLPDGLGSDLLSIPELEHIPVLSMSSDDAPDLPAFNIKRGSRFFLPKSKLSGDLFVPICIALVERGFVESELREASQAKVALDSVKQLCATLQHEIYNPLGAVFGAVYLLKSENISKEDREEAIRLAEESANRIKNVIHALQNASDLETVTKGTEDLFQVPGDPSWKK